MRLNIETEQRLNIYIYILYFKKNQVKLHTHGFGWDYFVLHNIAIHLHAKLPDLADVQHLLVTLQSWTHCSAIMQTAHILCLTTLEVIQVGQSAVSYLETVLQRPGDASLFTKKNMWENRCQHNDKALCVKTTWQPMEY